MEGVVTSLNLISGRFLGSSDRVIVAGNGGSSASVEVYLSLPPSGSSLVKAAQVSVENEHAHVLEVCGIPRLMKTFAVLGGANSVTGRGRVDFFDLEVGLRAASLQPSDSTLTQSIDHDYPITALAFNGDRETLVGGSEAGQLLVWDLYTQKQVLALQADALRVNKVQFTPSGQVAVAGSTRQSPAKIFDLRSGQVAHTLDAREAQPSPSFTSAGPHGFLSLRVHPTAQQVFCGDRNGGVVAWDLRTNRALHFQPHAAAVTDILVHPRRSEEVITASLDGSLRTWSWTKVIASSPLKETRKTLNSEVEDFPAIWRQAQGLQALDVEGDALLVLGRAGLLHRLPLPL
eukprot:gene2626-2870_t